MKTGFYDQAAFLYRKAYNLGSSSEFVLTAALGAGKCYYQMKDYESAKKWLTRYIELTKEQKRDTKQVSQNTDSYTAYLLLGKTYLVLGNYEAACAALQKTTMLAAAGDDYFEAVTSLVETQIKQDNFIGVLAIIENAHDRPFTQAQLTKLLILKSRALRAMGLTDQALAALLDRERFVADSQLRASLIIEMARCNAVNRDLDKAKERLTAGLSMLTPGPEAQTASLELADVCLKLGENQEVIKICNQLIGSSQDESIKRKASEILASTYNKQQDYDKAAQAILMVSRPR
jgi:tetratricopeptide (TPR) repeat protein